MNHQKIAVYCGLIFCVLYGIGWWPTAGFFPPPLPTSTASEIANQYQTNTWRIQFGLILTVISVTLLFPWVSVISLQLKRIEGSRPLYAWTQLATGTAGVMIIYFASFIWLLGTFRPDRPIDVTYLINDMGWLLFTTTLAPFLAQVVSIGMAIISDKSPTPVFPQWLGFYNIAVASLFVPACIIFFFKTGPFAWNGLITFWVPVIDFFVWIIVMSYYLLKAIDTDPEVKGA
jgi:hypothetical protein